MKSVTQIPALPNFHFFYFVSKIFFGLIQDELLYILRGNFHSKNKIMCAYVCGRFYITAKKFKCAFKNISVIDADKIGTYLVICSHSLEKSLTI